MSVPSGRQFLQQAAAKEHILLEMLSYQRSQSCLYVSLGSRPSPYVRVLIARGWANRSSGKAWDDSSREA